MGQYGGSKEFLDLVTGNKGTWREVTAFKIHRNSSRFKELSVVENHVEYLWEASFWATQRSNFWCPQLRGNWNA